MSHVPSHIAAWPGPGVRAKLSHLELAAEPEPGALQDTSPHCPATPAPAVALPASVASLTHSPSPRGLSFGQKLAQEARVAMAAQPHGTRRGLPLRRACPRPSPPQTRASCRCTEGAWSRSPGAVSGPRGAARQEERSLHLILRWPPAAGPPSEEAVQGARTCPLGGSR